MIRGALSLLFLASTLGIGEVTAEQTKSSKLTHIFSNIYETYKNKSLDGIKSEDDKQ